MINIVKKRYEKQMNKYIGYYLEADKTGQRYESQLKEVREKLRNGESIQIGLFECLLHKINIVDMYKKDYLATINNYRDKLGYTPMYVNEKGFLTISLNKELGMSVSFKY